MYWLIYALVALTLAVPAVRGTCATGYLVIREGSVAARGGRCVLRAFGERMVFEWVSNFREASSGGGGDSKREAASFGRRRKLRRRRLIRLVVIRREAGGDSGTESAIENIRFAT